jgi:hypothetical protein
MLWHLSSLVSLFQDRYNVPQVAEPFYSTYQLTSNLYEVNYTLRVNSTSENQEIPRLL